MSEKLKNKKNENNYAFIDSQNLNIGIRKQGWRLDFKKFRIYLSDKYNVSKAFIFIGYVSENELLYKSLRQYGYILIFKPTLEFKQKKEVKIKGNVDAELVLHTMIELKNFNKAVIVSSDGDFHCLIEYLESKNKLERIIAPNRKYSSLLRRFSKYITQLGSFKNQLAIKKTKISGRSKS